MARDWYEDLAGAGHKSAIVERVLRERGIDPVAPRPAPAPPRGKPLPPAHETWPDQLIELEDGRRISTTLAAIVHYSPAAKRDIPNDIGDEGYGDMIHD